MSSKTREHDILGISRQVKNVFCLWIDGPPIFSYNCSFNTCSTRSSNMDKNKFVNVVNQFAFPLGLAKGSLPSRAPYIR